MDNPPPFVYNSFYPKFALGLYKCAEKQQQINLLASIIKLIAKKVSNMNDWMLQQPFKWNDSNQVYLDDLAM